jgi:hypothetical protein
VAGTKAAAGSTSGIEEDWPRIATGETTNKKNVATRCTGAIVRPRCGYEDEVEKKRQRGVWPFYLVSLAVR